MPRSVPLHCDSTRTSVIWAFPLTETAHSTAPADRTKAGFHSLHTSIISLRTLAFSVHAASTEESGVVAAGTVVVGSASART